MVQSVNLRKKLSSPQKVNLFKTLTYENIISKTSNFQNVNPPKTSTPKNINPPKTSTLKISTPKNINLSPGYNV